MTALWYDDGMGSRSVTVRAVTRPGGESPCLPCAPSQVLADLDLPTEG